MFIVSDRGLNRIWQGRRVDGWKLAIIWLVFAFRWVHYETTHSVSKSISLLKTPKKKTHPLLVRI